MSAIFCAKSLISQTHMYRKHREDCVLTRRNVHLEGQLHDVSCGSDQGVAAPLHLHALYDVPVVEQTVLLEACTAALA